RAGWTMAVEHMKKAALIVTGTGGVFFLAVSIFVFVAARYPDRPAGGSKTTRIVVEKGMPLGEIAKKLHEGGVLDPPSWFKLYANERGMAQKIRAGAYTFNASMSPRQLLEKLVEGVPVEEVSVTIPEGKNLLEIAERLEQAGVCSKSEAEK